MLASVLHMQPPRPAHAARGFGSARRQGTAQPCAPAGHLAAGIQAHEARLAQQARLHAAAQVVLGGHHRDGVLLGSSRGRVDICEWVGSQVLLRTGSR